MAERTRIREGRIQEILGGADQPGIDVLSIARGYDLPMDFPEKVIHQADRVPDHVLESDFQGRMDLREWTVVTIDGEDAKDLDDGISLTKEGNIYHLGVHIADVTNYVQGGSALDREALRRGTSVYLVDRVIPMLPKRLSNGICSLNQGEDRLALSCLMDIDAKGKIVKHKIAETVILCGSAHDVYSGETDSGRGQRTAQRISGTGSDVLPYERVIFYSENKQDETWFYRF